MSRRQIAGTTHHGELLKTLKVEQVYQVRYDTWAQARLDIVDWIEGFYKHVPMHTAIGYFALVEREIYLLAASLGVRGNEAGAQSRTPITSFFSPARTRPYFRAPSTNTAPGQRPSLTFDLMRSSNAVLTARVAGEMRLVVGMQTAK
jgi:hypothetical protein